MNSFDLYKKLNLSFDYDTFVDLMNNVSILEGKSVRSYNKYDLEYDPENPSMDWTNVRKYDMYDWEYDPENPSMDWMSVTPKRLPPLLPTPSRFPPLLPTPRHIPYEERPHQVGYGNFKENREPVFNLLQTREYSNRRPNRKPLRNISNTTYRK